MRRLVLTISITLALVLSLVSCTPSQSPTTSDNPQTIPSTPSSQSLPTPPPSQPATTNGRTQARVVDVIDGDTIDVDIGGSLFRVRYIGMDTPERGEVCYEEATLANALLVSNKTVELGKDISETDRYGRLLRYVWIGEGMVNAILVATGYAQVVTYPPDVKYQGQFLELQRQAQQTGLGCRTTTQPSPQEESRYVGSINSDKYHYPNCRYVSPIYPENLIEFSSVAEAQAMGYVPCKVCKPPIND